MGTTGESLWAAYMSDRGRSDCCPQACSVENALISNEKLVFSTGRRCYWAVRIVLAASSCFLNKQGSQKFFSGTSLWSVSAQVLGFPQRLGAGSGYPVFRCSKKPPGSTAVYIAQSLDVKRKFRLVHTCRAPLATTTSLKN
jgi:hypothetical protein